jgi:low affinity Fe/Cu permease
VRFDRLSHRATSFTGSWRALVALLVLTAAWLVAGQLLDWNRPWELIITTGAPIATLVLVVILQHAQNRNARAMHVKLNELLTALDAPDDDVMDAEEKADDELKELDERYHRDIEQRRAASPGRHP